MKKLLITLLFSSSFLTADIYEDLAISNQLLAAAEYGAKTSWTVSELENIENLVERFSDKDLKAVWYGNLILYALTGNGFGNTPSSGHCRIAKNSIPKLGDDDLISLWEMNYSLYGCR